MDAIYGGADIMTSSMVEEGPKTEGVLVGLALKERWYRKN